MDRVNSEVKRALSVLDNEYVSAALSVFLVVYAGMAAPKLPERVARLFDNTLFRIVVFFLVAYSARKSPSVAAIAGVGLMVSLMTLSRYNINNELRKIQAQVEATVQNVVGGTDEEDVPEPEEVGVLPQEEAVAVEMGNVGSEEVLGEPEGVSEEVVYATPNQLPFEEESLGEALPEDVTGGCSSGRCSTHLEHHGQPVVDVDAGAGGNAVSEEVSGFDATTSYAPCQ